MASEVAKRLRDRRLNVWNDCKKLAEDAAGEQRSMTPEEQGRWDAMQEEMETLDKRIKSVLDTEKRAKEADEAFDELSGRKPAAGQDQRGGGGHDMQEEIRKFARGEEGAPKFIDVRHQGPGAINYRILTTAGVGGTNASSVIPTDFYDQLIAHLIEVSGIMQCGQTVINTGGGESLQIPKTTADSYPNANLGTDPASAAQAGNIPTSDPAFSMVTLSAYKFGVLLQVARELIDDTAVDLLGYLAMQAGRAIGNDFGYQLVNGLGTGSSSERPAQPGLPRRYWRDHRRVRCTVICQPGRMEYSVIAPYRQSRSCYWLAADKTIGGFRKITDTVGRPTGAVRGSRLTGPAARQAARRRPVHAAGRHRGEDDLLRRLQPVLRAAGRRREVRAE